ncbi:ABC transporter ATP-binding protein [Chlorogloeopsis fritschii PCC 9212]|uniref:ABC transporter ATP-binding protein n=1 Tax=Chlorogloeopsis fritschii PCC 6912 TaxID=211165 RepID=A0A433NKJ9_CHLFR|nr:ABC transporter ATP-binding protein [Chlorogloeopsis fritschii]RUR83325.1 ABC transporter ATP-binding protein [Chlorogloeopsis fritschii PCC 6912]
MGEIAISLKNVSKCYKRYARPVDRLKEILLPGKSRAQEFWALRDIDLKVPKRETVGIIGQNGSGKSTLLQIIAGTLTPTTGEVFVNGRVSALLELGSGFNPEFTGRQNVFFNGQILGLSREEIEAKFDDIASFAEIGSFIDEPVKTYSSGMFVRLAFSVAINVNPEILIVDESLAVGDGVFVHRCMAKIRDFQDAGGTILFVSHDVGAVSRLCSEAIWINQGVIVDSGKPAEVCKHYQAWIHEEVNKRTAVHINLGEHMSPSLNDEKIDISKITIKEVNPFTNKTYIAFSGYERFGTGRAEIEAVCLVGADDKPITLVYPGDIVRVRITTFRHDKVRKPNVGIALLDRLRTVLSGWSTEMLDKNFTDYWTSKSEIGRATVEFEFIWPHLAGGNYAFDIAFGDGPHENLEMLDWIQNAISIQAAVNDLVDGIFQVSGRKVSLLEAEDTLCTK